MKPSRPVVAAPAQESPRPRPLPKGADGADQVERGLGDLLDEERRRSAVRERRDADLHRAVEEDTASLVGWLRDAAEHGRNLLVEHEGGRLAGRVVGLGEDHVVLSRRGATGRSVVRLDAVVAVVEDSGGATPLRGRRQVPSGHTLRDVLVDAAEQRCEVRAHLRGRAEALAGLVTALGEDVVTFGGSGRPRVLVPLDRLVRLDLD